MSEHHSECVIEGEARPAWGRPPLAAVVTVGFLLAAIVGMTSAASPWVAGDGSGPSPPRIVTEVLALALATGLCILLALAWIHTPRRAKAKKKSGAPPIDTRGMGSSVRTGSLVLIGGILVAAALLLAFWFLLEQADQAAPPPLSATIGDAAVPPPVEPRPSPSAPPVFDWFLFGLVASVAVVLPLALIARRRLRTADESQPEDSEVPESVVRAVGESIDQIERDPDPRRAIIRAYAQMEHAFGDAGIPRRQSEAPFEYLGRALDGVRVSPPAAGRLAALFERARFSRHDAGAETKDEAIGALREIERQLQAPS